MNCTHKHGHFIDNQGNCHECGLPHAKWENNNSSFIDCPFCGTNSLGTSCINGVYSVFCHCCHATGPTSSTREKAINLWDLRAK